MWKLIDCGTYLWFVKQASKYFHCIKATSGEHKKIRRNDIRQPLYSGVRRDNSMAVSYLRNWNLDTADCIIDEKTYKFYHRCWKSYRKTALMKEILKQMKGVK
jgi:hypothetical protein